MRSRSFTRRQAVAAGLAVAALPWRAGAQPATLSFLALGDWGQAGAKRPNRRKVEGQKAVAEQMAATAAAIRSAFVMTVGDNFYDTGVTSLDDPHWQMSFESVYVAPSLQTPWHPALGNHDYDAPGDPDVQVAYRARNPRWDMPDRYYSVRRSAGAKSVELFVLDTTLHLEPRNADDRQRAARQKSWFEGAIRDSRADWKLVFGHHSVFSNGSQHGGERALQRWLKPLLEEHGAQAYVAGHDHDLQHIVTGPQGREVHYIQTGGGSDVRPVKSRDRWVPGTRYAKAARGFTAFQITDDVMNVTWVELGAAERDWHRAGILQSRLPAAIPA